MIGTSDDRKRYCDAWAQMMVDIWLEKAREYDIGHTGDLMRSFTSDVYTAAGGEVDKIVHAYNYYALFVELGVGRGVRYGNVANSNRKEKPFKNEAYWRSVKVLTEKMSELYGEEFNAYITEYLGN